MSSMQRNKGATGERELSHAIHDELGVRLTRNLEQSRMGGHDLRVHPDDVGPAADAVRMLAIEVKRHAKTTRATVAVHWHQAVTQADRARLWPCLAYREDRQPWRLLLPLAALWPRSFPVWHGADFTVETSIKGFAALVREGVIRPRCSVIVQSDCSRSLHDEVTT